MAPDVSKVAIDKRSDTGGVQITGGGYEDRLYETGPETGNEETRFVVVDIYLGQRCMIFGQSTVLYIRPRKKHK